jgi:hypothetical protein
VSTLLLTTASALEASGWWAFPSARWRGSGS